MSQETEIKIPESLKPFANAKLTKTVVRQPFTGSHQLVTDLNLNNRTAARDQLVLPVGVDPEMIANASGFSWADRASLGNSMGMTTYDGKRDLNKVLGRIAWIHPEIYRYRFERQGIATRIVEAAPDDCWAHDPKLTDKDGNPITFNDDVEAFDFELSERQMGLWSTLHWLDVLSGVGRYGLVLFGTSDVKTPTDLGKPITETLGKGKLKGSADLLYMSVYQEADVIAVQYDLNPASPTFARPVRYTIDLGSADDVSLGSVTVHASRCVHIAEKPKSGISTFGTPRLQAAFNDLDDIAKVTGATAEAAWRLAWQGIIIKAEKGSTINPAGNVEKLADDAAAYAHGLSRVWALEGADAEIVGGQVVDPRGQFDVLIDLISAATKIPKRKLLGNEAGELASTQDEYNWAGVIDSRRSKHVTPRIVRPVLKWLSTYGLLPDAPAMYKVEYEPAFKRTELDVANANKLNSEALERANNAANKGVPMTESELRSFGALPPELPTDSPIYEPQASIDIDSLPVPAGDDSEGDEPTGDLPVPGDDEGTEGDE